MAATERTDGRAPVRAEAKWVRMPARKARLVADHIRGRSVAEARTVLAFTPRAAAREIEKVLRSAVANAEANHNLFGDDLRVSAAYVDEGPTLKRWRARARGRVARIRKRTCHITIELSPQPETTSTGRAAVPPAEARPRRAPRRQPRTAPGPEPEAVVAETPPDERQAAEATPPAEERPKRSPEPPTEPGEAPKRRRTTRKQKEAES